MSQWGRRRDKAVELFLFVLIKFCWNTAVSVCLCTVYGFFCARMNSRNIDYVYGLQSLIEKVC